ncbi:hypothetical protein [Phaeovulum veldkampii]|uniref:hypothetical protein n=1 Tax=Phaeovulum veldkampii TaxID=33049 RepID=UPI00105CD7E2|nr:hypothetical protein [Phaeovulum veldkampii]TDQ61302.1 hypothetical protein EV658_10416 [Phaeovulum veldkampii DSM 11550]
MIASSNTRRIFLPGLAALALLMLGACAPAAPEPGACAPGMTCEPGVVDLGRCSDVAAGTC